MEREKEGEVRQRAERNKGYGRLGAQQPLREEVHGVRVERLRFRLGEGRTVQARLAMCVRGDDELPYDWNDE